MEMRLKFECGVWLRNGNFMAIKSITDKNRKQKIFAKQTDKWVTNAIENLNLKDAIS